MVERERGSALLVALVTIMVVTMAVLLVAAFVEDRSNAFRLEQRAVEATALADAAMAESLAELSRDRFFSGVTERPFGGGTIASTVTSVSPRRRQIRAEGTLPRWSAVIEAEIELDGYRAVVLTWTLRQEAGGG